MKTVTSLNSTLRIGKKVTDNYCFTSLKIGDKYDAGYVNKLYNMVRLQSDVPFFCFTDNTDGLNKNIETIDMDVTEYQDWYRWWPAWCKILMFNHLHEFDRKIFFDLDVIIHGDITPILEHDENFSLVYSKWKGVKFKIKNKNKSMYNSSCIVWKDNRDVYEYWNMNAQHFVSLYGGTDDFYHNEKIPRTALPLIFYSYRDGAKPDQLRSFLMREDHAVAILHQEPKNHTLNEDEHPIIKYWV